MVSMGNWLGAWWKRRSGQETLAKSCAELPLSGLGLCRGRDNSKPSARSWNLIGRHHFQPQLPGKGPGLNSHLNPPFFIVPLLELETTNWGRLSEVSSLMPQWNPSFQHGNQQQMQFLFTESKRNGVPKMEFTRYACMCSSAPSSKRL